MRVTCPNCGGDHPKWECKRPDTKSTASLREVMRTVVVPDRGGMQITNETGSTPPSVGPRSDAGETTLPVDTKPRRGRPKMEAPTSARAAYQREYVAKWRRGEVGNKYRSKAKEDKQNG